MQHSFEKQKNERDNGRAARGRVKESKKLLARELLSPTVIFHPVNGCVPICYNGNNKFFYCLRKTHNSLIINGNNKPAQKKYCLRWMQKTCTPCFSVLPAGPSAHPSHTQACALRGQASQACIRHRNMVCLALLRRNCMPSSQGFSKVCYICDL